MELLLLIAGAGLNELAHFLRRHRRRRSRWSRLEPVVISMRPHADN